MKTLRERFLQANDATAIERDIAGGEAVYVVDGDATYRGSVDALLQSMELRCKSFGSVDAFLESYNGTSGCVITDVRVPQTVDGIDLQQRLIDLAIGLPVIIVSASKETPVTVRAMQRGAITFLAKPFRSRELEQAIRLALVQGRSMLRRNYALAKLSLLSEREIPVLELVLDGATTRTIARRLNVSVRTVENRRHRIHLKTETNSIAQLVRMVVESQFMS